MNPGNAVYKDRNRELTEIRKASGPSNFLQICRRRKRSVSWSYLTRWGRHCES